MADRDGIFAGDDPMQIAARWLTEAESTEPNDANAAALSTVDASGMPNARIVLIKSIGSDSFVFYTNYNSAKGQELSATPKAAIVIHWKSLRRQIRVRGRVKREDGAEADAYYQSRAHGSRIGAWASPQSQPIETREALRARVADAEAKHGDAPDRPPFWGGFRITPEEIEFWSDGTHRLHDRFRWTRNPGDSDWKVTRLGP